MRAFALALLLTACAAAQTPSGGVDLGRLPEHIRMDLEQRDAALAETGVVAAGLNQTADLGNGLRVRPLEVLEDSRCPQNARCVWAGRLRLRVAVEGVGDVEIADDTDAPTQTPRGAFVLVAISPGPWTDLPQGTVPYRFGFRRA